MKISSSPSCFASNLQELIRFAWIVLSREEFAEFVASLAAKTKEEAA